MSGGYLPVRRRMKSHTQIDYIRYWTRTLDRHFGIREEDPMMPARSRFERTLTHVTVSTPKGVMERRTWGKGEALTWFALVVRVADLSHSPVKVETSTDALARDSNQAYSAVAESLSVLEAVGLIRRVKRDKQTSVTYLYVTPLPAGSPLVKATVPVVIDPLDGAYSSSEYIPKPRSKGTSRNKGNTPATHSSDSDDSTEFTRYLRISFPDHPYFDEDDFESKLNDAFEACSQVAGGGHPCLVVLGNVLNDSSPAGKMLVQALFDSYDLGLSLRENFAEWCLFYSQRTSE